MSTSTNTGLPDIELLTQLANQFFKAPPGNAAAVADVPQPLNVQGYNPAYQGYLANAGSSQSLPPDPHLASPVAAPSVSGAGISPSSAMEHIDFLDLKSGSETGNSNPFANIVPLPASVGSVHPQSNFDLNNFDSKNTEPKLHSSEYGSGKIPQSVAGSGKSPDAPHQYTDFNINDPQTSLPDPHFEDGKVPKSVAGSGRQPSLQNQGSNNKPAATKNDLLMPMKVLLNRDWQKHCPSSTPLFLLRSCLLILMNLLFTFYQK